MKKGCLLALSLTVSFPIFASDGLLNPHRTEPYGAKDQEYPQVCIRTNRTAVRTDFVGVLDGIIKEHGEDNLLEEITKFAASGKMGHTWVVYFNSPDEITTYGYHGGLDNAYQKNYQINQASGDSPSRKFSYQRCISVKDPQKTPEILEKSIIPQLNAQSHEVAKMLDPEVEIPHDFGVYTPVTSCAWFAGYLFNYITGDKTAFEQPYNWDKMADILKVPELKLLDKLADPGMVAESVSKTIKSVTDYKSNKAYMFMADGTYLRFNKNGIDSGFPSEINDHNWPGMEKYAFKIVSSFFDNNNTVYFFLDDGYVISYDVNADKVRTGYPKRIADEFSGFNGEGELKISAALRWSDQDAFLFMSDGRYAKVDFLNKNIVANAHAMNNSNWPGMAPYAKRIIGAVNGKDGNAYFFLTNQEYVIYNISKDKLEVGPQRIDEDPRGKYFKIQ